MSNPWAYFSRTNRPLSREGSLILAHIDTAILKLTQKVDRIMATLADIQTAETEEATAITSVLAEIAQLQTDLATAQAGGADDATIQAIVDQIHANTAKLTAALPPSSSSPPASTISGAGSGADTTTGAAA